MLFLKNAVALQNINELMLFFKNFIQFIFAYAWIIVHN